MTFVQEWDGLIRTANEAFAAHNNAKAIPNYVKALKLALDHFDSSLEYDPDQALTWVMTSHFGIAQAYASMRRFPIAVRQFNRCFHFFNTLLLRSDLDAQIQMKIHCALRVLEEEWQAFNKPLMHYPFLRDQILAVESASPHVRQCH